MNAIVVVDKNWAIGINGGLLTHLPGDLKYYKEKTLAKVIVIGRKTLESFPGSKPLPGRTNIVITRDSSYEAPDCIISHSRNEVLEVLKKYDDEDIFVSGGAEIYKEFMELCDVFYVTKIDESFEADRYFPNLDKMGFKIDWESPVQKEKGLSYRFLKYVRS